MNQSKGLLVRLLALLMFNLLSACGGGGGGNSNSAPAGSGLAPVRSAISGTVLDRQGQPVAGVTVTVYSNNSNTAVTTTTGANGGYAVTGLYSGSFTTGALSDYAVYAEKAGYGFTASVGDPAGVVNREDFNGNYRTVIRFLPMPAHDVAGANFTALRAGEKVVSLARTGQVASYAAGDDVAQLRGVAWPGARFVDNSDGTITDRLTGLVWLKDAGCFGRANWSTALSAANQLANGTCGLADGSSAGQWRMPNANELESLVDVSQANPAVSSGSGFKNVQLAAAYWSSTTYTAGPGNAMAIRFTDGRWINGADSGDGGFSNNKTAAANALWPVKSGGAGGAGAVQLLATGVFSGNGGGSGQSFGTGDDASLQTGVHFPSPRFIDNGDGTVADTATGLIWLKKADCIIQSWASALATIQGLASGQCGLADGSTAGQWRMPNRTEMLSLSDRAPTFPQADYFDGISLPDGVTVTNPVIFNHFKSFVFYWTSTTDAADTTQAWTIFSCDFGVYNKLKTDALQYALAVR
jgi:hypothetical protein